MATVVNNPGPSGDGSSSAVGIVVGILAAVVVAVLFFVYGLPAITGSETAREPGSTTIDIDRNMDAAPPSEGSSLPPPAPATPESGDSPDQGGNP